jgi:hypothetical protein
MMSDIRCVTNATSRVVVLPPVFSFPKGIRLVPGLNRVPSSYFEEAEQYELPASTIKVAGRNVKQPARKPIMETLAELQRPLWRPGSARRYRGVNGPYDGPQLVIHADASVFEGRDEGPPPPDFLPADEKLALAIVERTSDHATLTRWRMSTRDNSVQAALARRLANLMTPTTAAGV